MLIVGSLELVESDTAAQVTNASTGTGAVTAQEKSANASTIFDSLSFDRMLEAASSGGGMSVMSENDGEPQDIDRTENVKSNTNAGGESAGRAALAEALARHNITAQSKLAANGQLHNDDVSSD